MKKNDGKSEDKCEVEEIEHLKNFKNEEKLKLKIFNFCWWRIPPYKNADFRRRVQLSRDLRIKFFVNFFTLRGLVFIN